MLCLDEDFWNFKESLFIAVILNCRVSISTNLWPAAARGKHLVLRQSLIDDQELQWWIPSSLIESCNGF